MSDDERKRLRNAALAEAALAVLYALDWDAIPSDRHSWLRQALDDIEKLTREPLGG